MNVVNHRYNNGALVHVGIVLAIVVAVCSAFFVLSSRTEALSSGYQSSDKGLSIGMVASIAPDSDGKSVVRATQGTSNKVVGIVVNSEDALVSVSSGNDSVLVESDGVVKAYVSDIGGDIKKGDHLVMSPIKGILMRTDRSKSNQPVIGLASELANYNKSEQYELSGDKEYKIGITQVKISLTDPSLSQGSGNSSLSSLGHSMTGRDVSAIRVALGLVLFIVLLVVEGALLYGAISSSIIAVGRNPLSHKAVRIELMKVIITALLVFVVGLGAIYITIWL